MPIMLQARTRYRALENSMHTGDQLRVEPGTVRENIVRWRIVTVSVRRKIDPSDPVIGRQCRYPTTGNPHPMFHVMNFPVLVFVLSFTILWISVWGGGALRRRWPLSEDAREDFGVILTASLTLLGLIIGFSFSMAVSRYDQRKVFEEEEANAIGTEYARADLLPTAEAMRVRALLRDYLEQRIVFYKTRSPQQREQINDRVTRLQAELWGAVSGPAREQPTPLMALVVAGMNDVLNSQGYTQAAWWNRIPVAAWILMTEIAIGCGVLIGYGARASLAGRKLLLILPLMVSLAFFLIADIDSPRGGVIRVNPKNLMSLDASLRTR